MNVPESLPAMTVGIIAVVALLSGPFGVVDFTSSHEGACQENVFPGDGNATIEITSSPDTATLSKARFGAEVYRLGVPPVTVNVSDVEGRPLLSYRIRVPRLSTELGSTTVLSSCTTGERTHSIPQATFEPNEIDNESYDATLFVVYRATEQGAEVERELLVTNVTVEVEE